jgi:putative DNA primase/helicase
MSFRPEYIQAAIQNEADRVASAAPSTRNDTLNEAAFNLASLGVPGREIIHSLQRAALRCGLKNGEIYSTINSGMRAGKQHPRSAPANGYTGPRSNVTPIRAVEPSPVGTMERCSDASSLPSCDAPDKFKVAGDDGPSTLGGELRRHVYRRAGRPVRVKIKLERNGETRFQNWYAVTRDGVSGWQAQKPAEYFAVPYVGNLNPFDDELASDDLIWTEGEKDVDTLARGNIPAFTFGGTGDGLPAEAVNYLKGRRVVILADNDDGGRAHAEKKAALAHEAGAASVRVVHFPELPPKADVSDFVETGGTVEQLHARIDAAPEWIPRADAIATSELDGLVARSAADITPKKVDWAWPNRIALGKHTMIGGEGGLSKSQFLAFLAATISTGGAWPADEGKAPLGNVIMFSAEDDPEDTIVPRLAAAGANLSRVRIVEAARDANGERLFDLQRDLKSLEREVESFENVNLVTFDPISSYLGSKIDGNSNNDVRRVLEPLSRIAARHQAAIVSLTHSPKGSGSKALNQFIGSAAFVNVVRAAFLVMRDPDDIERILFLTAKNNLGKDPGGLAYRIGVRFVGEHGEIPAPYIVWEDKPVAITANEALAAARGDGRNRSATDEAGDFLREILADGPVPQKDVEAQADGAGLSWAAVKRAKKAAGVKAERRGVEGERGGGGWYWSIGGMTANHSVKGLRGSGENLSPLMPSEPLNGGGL